MIIAWTVFVLCFILPSMLIATVILDSMGKLYYGKQAIGSLFSAIIWMLSTPDYIYVPITAIMIVGAAVILGSWLNERKLKRTRDMYRDIDVKEW